MKNIDSDTLWYSSQIKDAMLNAVDHVKLEVGKRKRKFAELQEKR